MNACFQVEQFLLKIYKRSSHIVGSKIFQVGLIVFIYLLPSFSEHDQWIFLPHKIVSDIEKSVFGGTPETFAEHCQMSKAKHFTKIVVDI